VFLFSVFTAAAGFTNDPITFSVMRFLAGLGIGGAIPTAAAQMTEYSPKKVRGLMVTLMCCGYAVGSILGILIGLMGAVVGGWFASGEPMNVNYYRTRDTGYGRTTVASDRTTRM